MKTKLLVIVAIGLVLFPLITLLQFHMGDQLMVNGFTVSGSIIWLISIIFSMISWFLFAWASKNIRVDGILLSVISGTLLIIPFNDMLGPMASVIIGLVAGFVTFMFHKFIDSRNKKFPIIIIATIMVSYLASTMIIFLASSTVHIWDTGDGIDTWSGTADGIERQVHFDWRIMETLWIIILIIPGVIIAYKFYEQIKLKY